MVLLANALEQIHLAGHILAALAVIIAMGAMEQHIGITIVQIIAVPIHQVLAIQDVMFARQTQPNLALRDCKEYALLVLKLAYQTALLGEAASRTIRPQRRIARIL